MYLGITRLYAVLHGTFVISCLEKISDSYETCDFPFSCFCRIDFRIVPPADRDAAIRYRGDGYRSGTRRNTLSLPVCLYLDRQCRRSFRHCRRSRNPICSISSDWSISRAGCRRLSIYLSGSSWTSISVPWMSRYPSGKPKWRWRSSPRPVWWIRCWSIRFRVRTIRAVRTVCTASIAIIIPLRAVMSWLCPTCSMRHDRRL